MIIEYLTYTNYGYINFTKNNILNFLNFKDDLSKLTVVALDKDSYIELTEFLKDRSNDIILKLLETPYTKDEHFNSPNFKNITSLKLRIIYQKLLKCEILHFFDGDVFFFKNPRQNILEKIKDNDMVFQQDSPRSDGHILYSNYVCTGNFTIKNTDNSLILLDKLIKLIDYKQNDQELLYNYLNSKCSNIKDFKECDFDVYDPELFQNGYDTFKFNWYEKENKVAIHANHMIGKDTKINSLKSVGAWLV